MFTELNPNKPARLTSRSCSENHTGNLEPLGLRSRKGPCSTSPNTRPRSSDAIELALKNKDDLSALVSPGDVNLEQGKSVGSVFTLFQMARRLGIEKTLGADHAGKLALWQVIGPCPEPGLQTFGRASGQRTRGHRDLGL